MMARPLATIHKEMLALQAEAEEVSGVIERIKEAIQTYGLSPADLFDGRKLKTGAAKTAKAASTGKAPRAKSSTKKKTPGVVRFRNEAGNTWTGHGKRPNWFKEALAAGKTAEELAVPQ